jgi:hypothetical protein
MQLVCQGVGRAKNLRRAPSRRADSFLPDSRYSRPLSKDACHAERSEARQLTGCFSLKTNKKQILLPRLRDDWGLFRALCWPSTGRTQEAPQHGSARGCELARRDGSGEAPTRRWFRIGNTVCHFGTVSCASIHEELTSQGPLISRSASILAAPGKECRLEAGATTAEDFREGSMSWAGKSPEQKGQTCRETCR